VHVPGCPLDVGTSSGSSLLEADVRVAPGPPVPADAELLWHIDEHVDTPEGAVHVDQRLYRLDDGTYSVTSSRDQSVTVDAGTGSITVEGRDDGVRGQLLTTFGLPLALTASPHAFLLHASACRGPDGAVVVCGASGTGKSSALVGLLRAGWDAVSEDTCVLDLRVNPPRVWPGPPWVRRAHGLEGPPGAQVRFTTPDKTAWDIAPWQAHEPVPVSELVFMEPPGGEEVSATAVGEVDAVPLLARHAVWLGHPDERGRRLFGPAVDVAGQIPARRLRLPVSPSWLDRLPDVLAVPGSLAGA
jgi:hypothetical protein